MNKWIIISSIFLILIILITHYINTPSISPERQSTICQKFCKNARLNKGKYTFTAVRGSITCDCSCPTGSCFPESDS